MENLLKYNSPAQVFEEALPLGNGSLGAMVYGDAKRDRISLNHDTLWSGTPSQTVIDTAYDSYIKAQKLVFEGKVIEAQRELEQNFTGPWLNAYMPLGTLYIESDNQPILNYQRTLNLKDSLVNVGYEQDGKNISKEYFTSNPDDCLAIKITTTKPTTFTLTYESLCKNTVTAKDNALYLNGECPTTIGLSYAPDFKPITYTGDGVKFSAVAKVVSDGKTQVENDKLKITNAQTTFIFLCVKTSFISFDKAPNQPTLDACVAKVDSAIKKGYEKIKADHLKDVWSLYNRVSLDLSQPTVDLPTDKRLENCNDIGLYELLFNFGRYLIIASSRKSTQATNLQGIWNESLFPPWGSNYTVNINTQMNYWPVLPCDLEECNYPLIDLIKSVRVNGRQTAKEFYNAKGFVAHHNIDLWANTTPVGAKEKYSALFSFWNMSSGWLCRHLFEHYEYTQDITFLRETAYPIMRECAEFYLSVMVKKDGLWIITPSTSPENNYLTNGEPVAVAPYTTMSQSICYDLFTNLLTSANALGVNDEFTREIAERQPLLLNFKIGDKGQLLEFDQDYAEHDQHHRHVSHLYALYPASIITTEKEQALTNACKKSLELRGEYATGWSLAWKVNLWAKLKDGDRALDCVKTLLNLLNPREEQDPAIGGIYPNLFSACPPFQIDANFGVTAGLLQMFVQHEDGKIKVLPALPQTLPNGKLYGVATKGKVKLDIVWKDGKLIHLSLLSPTCQKVTVEYNGNVETLSLVANQKLTAFCNE